MRGIMRSLFVGFIQKWNAFLIWLGIKNPPSFRDKLPPGAREHYDAIVKLLNPGANRTTVHSDSGSKNTYSKANLWTVQIGSIESFLVAEFQAPSISKSSADEPFQYGTLFMTFYDAVGGSMVSRLFELLKNGNTDLTVKMIDNVGTVLEVWKMRVRPAAIHPLTTLDYTKEDPIKWQLQAECLEWEVYT
jgi:hypothetical protein